MKGREAKTGNWCMAQQSPAYAHYVLADVETSCAQKFAQAHLWFLSSSSVDSVLRIKGIDGFEKGAAVLIHRKRSLQLSISEATLCRDEATDRRALDAAKEP